MTKPTASPSTERIRLHSAVAKPAVCVVTGIFGIGALAQATSILAGEGTDLIVAVPLFAVVALLVWKMWRLYQRVYMTRAGIELTRPPRLVPWSNVGDAFRIPMTGSLTPICCIGISDPDNWDLHFLGRADFDEVVARGCPSRQERANDDRGSSVR